ncbi:MAG: zinc transporter ZntB [Phycisphaeraceae bacterium]|nr:zinc transporter ZntB [Phycisphaeraceae bacterium]
MNDAAPASADGRIFEMRIGPDGSCRDADHAGPPSSLADGEWTWHHRELRHPRTHDWLADSAAIDEIALQALLVEDARPRVLRRKDGIVVVFRGVNLNAGAEPEDMISVRVWCDSRRFITLRTPHVQTIHAMRTEIEAGDGPGSPGEALVELAAGLTDRIAPVLDRIDQETDDLEEEVSTRPVDGLRSRIAGLKRRVIAIRRYLAPQRDALLALAAEQSAWMTDLQRSHFRESADRVTRLVEDLDELRDREVVIHEELVGRLAEQLNRNMYMLSLFAGLFLPLGFITGLLGVNVGGIPGVNSTWGFAVLCAVLVVIAVVALYLFRRLRLLPPSMDDNPRHR